MASIATSNPIENPTDVLTESTPATHGSIAAKATPERIQLRLGRAITGSEGLNWATFSVMAIFHIGAIAALFLFTWQRLPSWPPCTCSPSMSASACAITACLPTAATRFPNGWNTRWRSAPRCRLRADRSSGYRRIASITSSAITWRPPHPARGRLVGAYRVADLGQRSARADRSIAALFA